MGDGVRANRTLRAGGLALAGTLLLALGCQLGPRKSTTVVQSSEPPKGKGVEHEAVQGIRIVESAEVREADYEVQPLSLAFGDGEDGTKLVVALLRQAKAKGAQYVSDIQTQLTTPRDQGWMQCTTRMVVEDKTMSEKTPVVTPGRTEGHHVLKPVQRTVTEYQYRCRMVSKPVQRMVTKYESSYDYSAGRSTMRPVTRYETRYESQQECRNEPVTRTVTRYENQYETRYVPPQLHVLVRHYTDRSLRELAPTCDQAPAPSDPTKPHLITALTYVRRP